MSPVEPNESAMDWSSSSSNISSSSSSDSGYGAATDSKPNRVSGGKKRPLDDISSVSSAGSARGRMLRSDTKREWRLTVGTGFAPQAATGTIAPSKEEEEEKVEEMVASPPPAKATGPTRRPVARSVSRTVDISVFAQMISPHRLKNDEVYGREYVSFRIGRVHSLRYLPLVKGDPKLTPVLQFTGRDMNDRFELEYCRGVFDDVNVGAALDKKWYIYLVGTYALLASKKHYAARPGEVINILQFRNVRLLQPKPKKEGDPEKAYNPEPCGISPSCIFVHDDEDIESTSSLVVPAGIRPTEPDGVKFFQDLYSRASEMLPNAKYGIFLPMVSLTANWRAPADPKILNESLYIQRESKPNSEQEFTSTTVKQ